MYTCICYKEEIVKPWGGTAKLIFAIFFGAQRPYALAGESPDITYLP